MNDNLKPNPIEPCAEEMKTCDEPIASPLPNPKKRKLC